VKSHSVALCALVTMASQLVARERGQVIEEIPTKVLLYRGTVGAMGLSDVMDGNEMLLSSDDVVSIILADSVLEVQLNGVSMPLFSEMSSTAIYWTAEDNTPLSGVVVDAWRQTPAGGREADGYCLKVGTRNESVRFISNGPAMTPDARYELVLRAANCKCSGSGGTGSCSDDDCDSAESCSSQDTAYCRWGAVREPFVPQSVD